MKVNLMYYDKKFKNKPTGYEAGGVQKNLKQTTIEISDLAEGLSNGATFKPALLSGTKSTDFISQQIFALDFDHDTTIEEQINRCKELNIFPCFGYTSFSHSEQEHHFRFVFCAEVVLTDLEYRTKLQLGLMSAFPKCDIVTKDASRLFYGGRNLVPLDFENRINAEDIINRFYNLCLSPIGEKQKNKPIQKSEKVITPKQISIIANDDMGLKIEAIKALNVHAMRELLGNNSPLIFNSDNDLYKYINSIDLSEYLGIYGKVNCILPEHEDNSPSACIWHTKDGTPIYKCFGCDKAYTIIGITEKLSGCKRSEAIEFIKKVYSVELVQSDWALKQKQLMIDSANYLDTEDFAVSNPELAKLIRTRKTHIQAMLVHFTQYVNEDMQIDGKPFFFASYPTLMKVCGINPNKRESLAQTLVLFSLLNMVVKLQITDIPEKELNEAKHIAAKYGFKKLTGFYQFEEYGTNMLEENEVIAKILKANNITLKGLSREYILRTFGANLANKCFPQYIYENSLGTTEKSDNATLKLSIKALEIIDSQGYVLERDIRGKGLTEIQWKKSIQEILNTYELIKVKASKENKIKYNIPADIHPLCSIIVKSNQ